MDNDKSNEATADPVAVIKGKLCELVRFAALSRLKVHTDCEEIEQAELGESFRPGRILANNMVFILASGEPVRVTFKAHFNIDTAKDLAFRVFGGDSAATISEKRAVDYFKEYSNLVAGSVVTLFEKIEIELGISLPLSTRGFYEVFADYQERQQPIISYSDFWALKVNGHTVFCSALLEILDRQRLEKLINFDVTEAEDNDDEEMDFL